MPIYSYRCTKCENEFEALVRSNEVPECPECGGVALERLLSAPSLGGKSKAIAKKMRAAAAREGHLSNFSRSERRR